MPVRTRSSFHPLSTLLVGCRALLVMALAAALVLAAERAPSAGGSDPAGGDAVAADDLRPVAARTTKIRNALRVAKNQIGDPYKYGAAGPNRFDCSGLVYFSTHRAGFTGVPRTSSAQARHMRHIKRSAMRPGDFVFFRNGSGVYHAAIYVGRKDGRRRIVHAPGSGQRVKRSTIWTNSWFPATLRR